MLRNFTVLFGLMLLLQATLLAQERIFYEHLKISASTESLQAELPEEGHFGKGVAAIGDLDGDLVTEIVAGAPDEDNGTLYVLFMNTDGTIKKQTKIGSGSPGFNAKLTPGGGFGSVLSAAGDWNKDGYPDLWVGEPYAKESVLEYGAVWLLLLGPEGEVRQTIHIGGRSKGLLGELKSGYRFGSDIAPIGDLNADGVEDVAIATPMDPDKASGTVWLLFLNEDGGIKSALEVKPEGLRTGDEYGIAVEALGDLNEDGIVDLAVGADRDDQSGLRQGAVYICFLSQKGKIKAYKKIVSKETGFSGYLDNDDRLGISLACPGDMNGDSIPDLAVGAYLDDDGGKDKGSVYMMYLNKDGTVIDNHKISESSRNFEGQFNLRYHWASALHALGDLNEDGRNDLLVSGEMDDTGGKGTGAVWMLFPGEFPARLLETGTWAEGAGTFSAADSARLFADAETAEDSAKIDSLYDLSGYAPNNLVFVLDVSASMNRPTKLPVLRKAFSNLLPYMRPEDKISVITYSGKAVTQLSGVPASEQEKILHTLENLRSAGETKPKKALKLAYELATFHFIPNANNRIIFGTDGGFDLEDVHKSLTKQVNQQVPLSVFYFGKLPDRIIGEMNMLAELGGGNAAHITSASAIGALLREIKTIRLKE